MHGCKPLWNIYLLRCKDGSTYTGIALDVEARFLQHASGHAAQHTRMHPPDAIVAALPIGTRAQACRFENKVKSWPKQRKLAYFEQYSNDWRAYNPTFVRAGGDCPNTERIGMALIDHASAISLCSKAEEALWNTIEEVAPALAETILQSGLDRASAARWACFPVEELGGTPAELIARGEASQVLAYVLRVTHCINR